MPRYVILEHDHPVLHWDFMLEAGDILRTWRLAAPPRLGQTIAAEMSFAHRLLYLDYEGPISGNRGQVVRWDHGVFAWQEDTHTRIIVQLQGERLQGTARLERSAEEAWWLTVLVGE